MSTRTGSSEFLREQGYDWDEALVRKAAPLVQEKIATLAEFPAFAGFLFARRGAGPGPARRRRARAGGADAGRPRAVPAESIEQALRGLAERLELKPREAFQPIRVAVTGSKISPGLFESIELLGRERDARADQERPGGSGLGGASGSSARWNSRQARRRNPGVGAAAGGR